MKTSTGAKKAAAKTSERKAEESEAALTTAQPEAPKPNQARAAYSIEQLIEEVDALFEDVEHDLSNYDAYNTALCIQFVTYDREPLADLLELIEEDSRVAEVLHDEDGYVSITVWPSLRTRDSRESFNLAGLLEVLDDDGSHPTTESDSLS